MNSSLHVDGVLVEWGDRLFYPKVHIAKSSLPPRFTRGAQHKRANQIRQRIVATVRRAPQVMVKVTGGGRGMAAIAAHFRYIAKNGRLAFEDDRGVMRDGNEALQDVAEQWRFGGSQIGDTSPRREAFNIMLSMPAGTDPKFVLQAAREFAKAEFADHRYVMVLHQHQTNPHVHLSVRAESRSGKRLNPRKTDLHRWRETFAEKLRGWGLQAEATRQAVRGEYRDHPDLWQVKAGAGGRLQQSPSPTKSGAEAYRTRSQAMHAWSEIANTLADSEQVEDRALGKAMMQHARATPFIQGVERLKQRQREQQWPDAFERVASTRQPTVEIQHQRTDRARDIDIER